MQFGRRTQRFVVPAGAVLLLGLAGGARALTGSGWDYPTGYQPRVYHDTTAAAALSPFARRPALDRLQTVHGGRWEAYFDEWTGTPVAVWGSGVALLGARETRREAVVQTALGFVDAHHDLFRVASAELELDYAYRADDLWYVNFRRTYQGVPVHLSNVALRFKAGRLVLFSAETYPDAEVETVPSLSADQALAVASSEVAYVAGVDQVERAPELRVYPDLRAGAPEYRLAWWLETRNSAPEGWFGYFVDAHSGELLEVWRNDAYDYSGEVEMDIDERTVGSPVVTVAGAYNRVTLGGTSSQNTDGAGRFVFAGSGGSKSLQSSMRGPYVAVTNRGGTSAAFSGTIADNAPFSLHWADGNSDASERDVFAGVNRTNRFLATVFPNVSWVNSAVSANVNLSQTCNAYWNGTINFFRAGGGCNATGRIFDVIAHEWGHGFDQNAPGGAQDGGLGEFIGDLVAMVQTGDHQMGPGFFTDGRAVRDMQDTRYECYDPSKTEVHQAGHLLGAVVYDIMKDMERVGISGEQLKRKLLLPIAGAQTRSQWYREMLVVDDDDGNLANGTPNECLIYNQFKLHSCGSTRWPGLPAGDPPNCSAGTRTNFRAADVPKGVPDNDPAGAKSSLTVAEDLTIDDLDVSVDIAHGAVGDLKLVLSHTATQTVRVVLHDRTGGDQDDLVTNYDRASPSAEPLAVFNGRSTQGTWALEVVDSKGGNTGTLRGWQIEVRRRN